MRGDRSARVEFFEDLYHYVAGPQDPIAQILAGHLAIEFLLRKLVRQYDPCLEEFAEELPHSRLISLNLYIGTISKERASVLRGINVLRNKFAHEILYELQLSELSSLFSAALDAFSDYSDEIADGAEQIRSASSVFDLDNLLLPGLFLAIVYDLHQECVSRGSDEERP